MSRITGLGKIAIIAAVLGPSYLGNLFQAMNLLPNVTYEFFTGALFGSLLVPFLIRHIDQARSEETERLAGAFLGLALAAFLSVTVLVVLAGPLILHVFSLGVTDRAAAAAQRRAGWPLLALLMPQVVFYCVAGVAGAVMNAHGRFALVAAAPALENLGTIATFAIAGLLFGTGAEVTNVRGSFLLLLGIGTTGSVVLHAAILWWGARRLGVRLSPRWGWRHPEVRQLMGRVVPSLAYAGLGGLRLLGSLVVANRLAGGVVGFQVALQFFYLPVAIGARPVAVALLPRLSRLHRDGKQETFRDELVRGSALALFVAVPAAFSLVVLAVPLAKAVSLGEMASATGVRLIAFSLATLGIGVIGEAAFVLATHASFARHDPHSPLRSMQLQTVAALTGLTFVFLRLHGNLILAGVGLCITMSSLIGAGHLVLHLRAKLPVGKELLTPSMVRDVLVSAVMLVPAFAVATLLPKVITGPTGDVAAMVAAGAVGALTYLAVQGALRSPELGSLLVRKGKLASVDRSA